MTYSLSHAQTKRPPSPNILSRTLPILKCGALVLLEAEGYCKERLNLCGIVRVLLYAVQGHNFLKFAEICVAILDDRLFFFVFLL